ncbi:MAG: CoA pyrophosphatase [bacterium]|nr:CoA pyrophosphatase [bacterium]
MEHLRFGDALRSQLTARLDSFEPRRLPLEDRRQAAVVLAVVSGDGGQAAVLLTRRSKGLRRHGGQFALPGGRVDAGETLEQAGLRELDEEVGLELAPSSLLGRLDDYVTRSGFRITPLVAWGSGAELTPDPGEVAKVYRVPLADAGRPKALKTTRFFPFQPPLPALKLKSVGTWVFCPTAAILHQFAELAVHGRHTPVADFPQPAFAWR